MNLYDIEQVRQNLRKSEAMLARLDTQIDQKRAQGDLNQVQALVELRGRFADSVAKYRRYLQSRQGSVS